MWMHFAHDQWASTEPKQPTKHGNPKSLCADGSSLCPVQDRLWSAGSVYGVHQFCAKCTLFFFIFLRFSNLLTYEYLHFCTIWRTFGQLCTRNILHIVSPNTQPKYINTSNTQTLDRISFSSSKDCSFRGCYF